MEERKTCCVTGGAGFVGSYLIKKLLKKGHVVHTTLRDLGDPAKVDLLKNLQGADTRLKLFQADLYDEDPGSFAPAIAGCDFVFHAATVLVHNFNSKWKDTTEATVASAKSILQSCIASRTVRRLIYTGTVISASPILEDGSGLFKDSIDESCWTPLGISFENSDFHLTGYASSKTLTERELLNHNDKDDNGGVEVVSLICGLVGGDTVLPYLSQSVKAIVSPLTGNDVAYKQLKFIHGSLGVVPLIHIEDICDAHMFCMEKDVMRGRFLCSAVYQTTTVIAGECQRAHGGSLMVEVDEEEKHKKVVCGSTKLEDMGFKYKYGLEEIIHDSVRCAKRFGEL